MAAKSKFLRSLRSPGMTGISWGRLRMEKIEFHEITDNLSDGNPLIDMASNVTAELQRPTPGLTERRGVGGGSPRWGR